MGPRLRGDRGVVGVRLRVDLPDPRPAGPPRRVVRLERRARRPSSVRPADRHRRRFTAWRSLVVLIIVGAVWGLLTGTRLLRGEEDAGRWELLLAGQTTRRRAAGQALAGLGAGLAALWAVTAVIVVAGRSAAGRHRGRTDAVLRRRPGGARRVFLAVGALTSQLAATRRQAAAYAGAVLGVCYALRMVADSGTGLDWLRWPTPLGWVEELHPLTAPRPLALVPIAGLVIALGGLSVYLAGARDLGASTLPDRDRPRPRTRLLAGPTGLAVRLVRPTVLAWTTAIALWALLLGFIAKQGGRVLTTSRASSGSSRASAHWRERRHLPRGDVPDRGLLVALIAAGQVTAARAEEAEGRLDNLLVRPVSRSSWLTGRQCSPP